MSEQFRCSSTTGRPSRVVDVTFKQIEDEDAFPKQNPTSGGRTGERVHRLGPRETLDQVAYDTFGDTGLWRAHSRRSTASTIPCGSRPATRSSCRPAPTT